MKNTIKFIFLLLLLFPLITEATHGVTGTPPTFDVEPQDIVVFARDAAGNRASLNLTCMVSGSPASTITWFRDGASLSLDQRITVNANGTLHIANITENTDTTRAGTSYHCTATNKFGTIRSRTANISYAYFGGFTGPSGVETVNVTTYDNDDEVALECPVADSNPPPQIRWLGNGNPLIEVTADNRLRFLDNGRYLLIRELGTAELNTNYQCQVTNARLHGRETSPTTYNLANNIGTNEFKIYKRLIDRTIVRGTTVELSYIAGAGPDINPFVVDECVRSGRTLATNLTLVPGAGGVISETIPRLGESIPAVADSLTFQVSCILFSGTTPNPSQATITVQAPPSITMSPSDDLERLVGERVTFTCVVEGIPTPTVTWYHNGGNPPGVTSVSGSNRNINTLTISSSAVGNTGMYQCTAENPVGKVQASWGLQVRTPMIMAVSSSSSDIYAMDIGIGLPLLVVPTDGGNAILFAVVTADPCPTVQWMVNGSTVSGVGYTLNNPCSSPAGTTSFNFTLTIAATSARTGTYTATLMNPAGMVNMLPVFVTPPVPVIITELRVSSGPRCLLSGTSVDMQCVNFGFPRPQIVFFRGTEQITPGEGRFSNFQTVEGRFDTLRLTMTQQVDGGDYVCEARRGNSELNRSRPVELVFCTHPTIVDLPAPMTHTEGTHFELVCTFTGIPDPQIHWKKDGNAFLLGEGRSIINTAGSPMRSVLEINNLLRSDAGVYNCSVNNDAGTDTRSVRLEVRVTTAALSSFTNFTVVAVSSINVSIMWVLENPGLQQVVVRWRKVTPGLLSPGSFPLNNTQALLDTPSHIFHFNFTGLSPAQLYVVLIQGTNSVGTSDTYFVFETAAAECDAEITEFLFWPTTPAGSTESASCPNTTTTITRICSSSGVWESVDPSLCTPFTSVNNDNITLDNYDEVFINLRGAVRGATIGEQEQTTGNLAVVTAVFASSAALVNNTIVIEDRTVQNQVSILGSLQQWNMDVLQANASNIVSSFEEVASVFAQQPKNETFAFMTDNILFVAELIPQAELAANGRTFSSSGEIGNTSINTLNADETAAVFLPASLFQSITNLDNIGNFFAVYDTGALFPIRNATKINQKTNASVTTVVGSPVLTATVGPRLNFSGLDEPVRILLRLNELENVTSGRPRCVSWNFNLEQWIEDGCQTAEVNGDVVTCNCNHITNFAILVDICSRFQDCVPSLPLEVLTVIGVVLSLIGLVATIVTLLLFKKLRERDATKFHIQLCIALFCMLIVFVAGIDQTALYEGCVAVSAMIHYFTLVAVMWMGAEAVLMFQKLVLVFSQTTTKFIIAVSLICWLVPVVPVVVPLAVDLSDAVHRDLVVRRPTTDIKGFCFISDPAVFFGAFLGPIFAILIFNAVIFVLVIGILIRHTRNKLDRIKKQTNKQKTVIRLLISTTGVMFLFGLTWIFGALTVTGLRDSNASTTFQALFVILNAFQGFFIFLFFCVFNKDARESWSELLSCGRYKSKSLHPLHAKYSSTGSSATQKESTMASTDLTFSNPSATGCKNDDLKKEERYTEIPLETAAKN